MSTRLDITAAYLTSQSSRTLHAGDHYGIDVTATRSGSPVNVGKAWFTVKTSQSQPDNEALIAVTSDTSDITITDAPNGELTINLTPALTSHCAGLWHYDVQVYDATNSEIVTVLWGMIEFLPNITRAYSVS